MPFTAISGNLTPLSNYWTYEAICSEAAILTNSLDNEENIEWHNIRNHSNISISHLAKLLNLVSSPWYGISMSGTFENTLHDSGLEFINLATPVVLVSGNFVPASQIMSIIRTNLAPTTARDTTEFIGNCSKKDLSELTNLNNMLNTQYRYSIAWTHHGSELLFFVGSGISTTAYSKTEAHYNVASQKVIAWGYRKPILDNLLPIGSANSNYRANIDLPDEYADLLIKMIQKKILEQRREQVPQALEAEINQGLAMLSQNLTLGIQTDSAEVEKRKYGNQQKPIAGTQ